MLMKLRKRMDEDKGFTLIELMVVILIIGILLAIAIPTFLGLRQRAQDRASQADLRTGLVAAKAYFTDDEQYFGFDAANEGEGTEPSLDWADGNAVSEGVVNITGLPAAATTVPQTIVLQTLSQSGASFCIADSSTEGTQRAKDPDGGTFGTFAGCDPTVAGLEPW